MAVGEMRQRYRVLLVLLTLLALTGLYLAVRTKPIQASALAQAGDGEAIYRQRCAICHGSEGDGNGPAAAGLDPKPRDFRRGWYKIRTTTSGQLPTDEDLVRIITEGMPGTTMPGWEGVLSEAEIRAVAATIKGFARRFERETPQAIEVGSKIDASPESLARGAELFAGPEAECIKCHGAGGRGDGPSADELTDDFDNVIVPADLTMPWLFRGGPAVGDIYARLKTGLTGSPMPSYADVLTDEDIWHLANYIDSLAPDAPAEAQPAITAGRAEGPLPAEASAAAWQEATEYYYPLVGQIMREPRNYTPAIGGVWVRALYNESEIALLLRWHDRFQDVGAQGGPADALAVQFPAELPAGDERPYFVLGDSAHAVNLWFWSATTNMVEERNATGVGTMTTQAGQNAQGAATFADGEYTLMVRRALTTADAEDVALEPGRFIPLAFMAWDGWRGEEDAAGAISSWYLIYLEKPTPPITYVWIPAAVLATALLEGWAVWAVRRAKRE